MQNPRWKQRLPGSTGGDFGASDQVGRTHHRHRHAVTAMSPKGILAMHALGRRFFICLMSVGLILGFPFATHAQNDYPDKPITLVVPYPPGGTTDTVGRQLANHLGTILKQTIIVANRAGAATAIGASSVARAPKDGYTLLLSTGSTFTTAPHFIDKLPYRLEDFAPVSIVTTVPLAFIVTNALPVHSVADYVTYAKAHPGKLNHATPGQGTNVHLYGELVAAELDVNVTQIHYRGAAAATSDTIAGIVDSNVEALTAALPNLRAGQYRALAVLSPQRQTALPEVPTFLELGYPSIVGETWYAVFAPAGTPTPVINTLNAAIQQTVATTAFQHAMHNMGNSARASTPEELLATTQREHAFWGALIKRLGLTP